MSLSYQVSVPNLGALASAFAKAPDVSKREISSAINRSLLAYQSTAKQLAPIDSGQLRSSILMQPAQWSGSTISGSVGSNLDHALFQETGTGIYGPNHTPIVPKTKPMLTWYSNGAWHFAKSVKGSKPRWFMKGSLEQNQGNTDRNFQQALDAVVSSIEGAAA